MRYKNATKSSDCVQPKTGRYFSEAAYPSLTDLSNYI